MPQKATHTMNGVMPADAQDMVRELKKAVRTSRKEVGIYMALKFILSNKQRFAAFRQYASRNAHTIDRVAAIIEKHERG